MSVNIVKSEDLLQDFIDVTIEVLSTMACYDVQVDIVEEVGNNSNGADVDITNCMDITGILGFSGDRKGSLLLAFTEEIALATVGGMLGMEFSEMDSDVRDGVGELVNMIAGGAKTRLQLKGIDFELSIPNTIIGRQHKITSPAATSRSRINFNSEKGNFFIEVYLKED